MSERTCPVCLKGFAPVRETQRYCSAACRTEYRRNGVQGLVSSVTIRRDGGVAVTLYFDPIDRPAASGFTPGTLLRVGQ